MHTILFVRTLCIYNKKTSFYKFGFTQNNNFVKKFKKMTLEKNDVGKNM